MNMIAERKSIFHYWFSLKPWQRIMTGLVAGLITGLLLGPKALCLRPIGTIFINAIHMMVIPVVFTAIVCALISMGHDALKMQRIGIKTILLYTLSMGIAATIGLTLATFLCPGQGLHLAAQASSTTAKALPTVTDLVVNMVPANPVGALADGNILQILVFALIFGIAINLAGEKGVPVANLFKSLSTVVFKLAGIVMAFAPFGIFALMACVLGEFGVHALIPLVKLIGTIFFGYLLLGLIFYSGTIAIFLKLNPGNFFKGILDAILFALSSSSSTATLPTSIRCAEENLGISKGIAGFLLPLGTSLNLNGLSIYLSVATVFAANIYGVHLHFTEYLTVAFTIVLTCMGAGGVPGSAIFVISAVMSSIGLPLGAVPLVAGVDRIIDMGSTMMNVTGDIFAALVIAKSENELDEKIYNKTQAVDIPESNAGSIDLMAENPP